MKGMRHSHHRGHGPDWRSRRGGPFGEFGFGGFGGRGPGGRRPRGDVRAAALLLLEEEPRNGYALMQEIENRSEGVWRPSPGSMYPALAQLEDEGLIAAAEGGGSGRSYSLTDTGRAHVEEHREQLGEPWKAVTGGMPKELFTLRDNIGGIAQAAAEVMRSGSDAQRAEAIKVLADTRRALYRIMAEEPAS